MNHLFVVIFMVRSLSHLSVVMILFVLTTASHNVRRFLQAILQAIIACKNVLHYGPEVVLENIPIQIRLIGCQTACSILHKSPIRLWKQKV